MMDGKPKGMPMSISKALKHKAKLEEMVENWNKQGLTKEQKKVRIGIYLTEAKRKHLKEEI